MQTTNTISRTGNIIENSLPMFVVLNGDDESSKEDVSKKMRRCGKYEDN